MTEKEKADFIAALAAAKAKLVLPTDDALKAKVKAIALELKKSPTTGDVNLCCLIRLLGECKVDLASKHSRTALLQWLGEHGHGLGANASQLGQWVMGKGAKAVEDFMPTEG
jgi:hypothetical protein